jgi:hypothetical protein
MLTLRGGQVEVLWDEVLPIEARELPEDLAGWIACCVIRRCWGPCARRGQVRRVIVAARRSRSTCLCG